jgi:small-conductance mechanosensitive channel
MPTITTILEYSFWGNTVTDYLYTLGIGIGLILVLRFVILGILIPRLAKYSERTTNDIDDTVIAIIKDIKPSFYIFISFFLAVRILSIHEYVEQTLYWMFIIWITVIVVRSLRIIVDYLFQKKINQESGNTIQALQIIKKIIHVLLWFFAILFLLSNMGVNVTSVFAGLGIGGIAVALAIQNILSDLFSSFAIYFDKPFEVDDFIIVGDKMGVVEKIGIKTTRIRALQGEEVVISNQELTNAQIQNFKKLIERRVTFGFGVTYDTSNEKLERIKSVVQDIIEPLEFVRFDRCHFYRFDDSALYFETVYYVHSGEYNVYMDVQEQINLAIKKAFEEEDIDMAFPTQTIHIAGGE